MFSYTLSRITDWGIYAEPVWFWLLLLIPILTGWRILKAYQDKSELSYSSTSAFKGDSLYRYTRHIPFALSMLALTLFVFSLARPQDSKSWEETKTEGIDILLTMDVSTSMLYEDFKPNRLEAAKKIAQNFIEPRKNDRFGLVVFAGESFTQCPLTIDQRRVIELFDNIKTGLLEDGTAIGSGLATAVSRLKDSDAKSKVIILLTDGENNSGELSPKTSAELAKKFGIRLYTIGVGTDNPTIRQKDIWGRMRTYQGETKIDEKLMTEMAEMTGGQYFRARSNTGLKEIYEEIDSLEKTELASLKFYKKTELFSPLSILAFIILIISKTLKTTSLRRSI